MITAIMMLITLLILCSGLFSYLLISDRMNKKTNNVNKIHILAVYKLIDNLNIPEYDKLHMSKLYVKHLNTLCSK